MNREILFRGKRFGNGEWVEGYFAKYRDFQNKVYTSILQFDKDDFGDAYCCGKVPVIPETVGQFTGLRDRNGKAVYEGDIVEDECTHVLYIIEWDDMNACFSLAKKEFAHTEYVGDIDDVHEMEVISNIHDNPELLEDEE